MGFEREFDRLRGEMEDLFSELWHGQLHARHRRGFRPAADVFRTADPPAVTVLVDLAGVDPAEVELAFSDGVLSVSGIRRRPPPCASVYQQIELDYGPFERRIPVGSDVDGERAEATYSSGMLTITIPLAERPAGSTRVPINLEGEA